LGRVPQQFSQKLSTFVAACQGSGESAVVPQQISANQSGGGMKVIFVAALVCLGLAASAGFSQTNGGGSKETGSLGEPASLPASLAAPTYKIGTDDMLLVSVWKEPDLTITLPVRPDGNISMPLLNDVKAAGLTPTELAGSITDKLKKYVANPRVTVVVTQINSQRVYVTGEVQHTGAIQLLPDMTVLQALANAGFTQFANTKSIYVLRTTEGQEQRISINYKHLVKGQGTNLKLEPGDTIVVP
jgi:polysaccharide biosynthesis/export protein